MNFQMINEENMWNSSQQDSYSRSLGPTQMIGKFMVIY